MTSFAPCCDDCPDYTTSCEECVHRRFGNAWVGYRSEFKTKNPDIDMCDVTPKAAKEWGRLKLTISPVEIDRYQKLANKIQKEKAERRAAAAIARQL